MRSHWIAAMAGAALIVCPGLAGAQALDDTESINLAPTNVAKPFGSLTQVDGDMANTTTGT